MTTDQHDHAPNVTADGRQNAVSSCIKTPNPHQPPSGPTHATHRVTSREQPTADTIRDCTPPEDQRDHELHRQASKSPGNATWVTAFITDLVTPPPTSSCRQHGDTIAGKPQNADANTLHH